MQFTRSGGIPVPNGPGEEAVFILFIVSWYLDETMYVGSGCPGRLDDVVG